MQRPLRLCARRVSFEADAGENSIAHAAVTTVDSSTDAAGPIAAEAPPEVVNGGEEVVEAAEVVNTHAAEVASVPPQKQRDSERGESDCEERKESGGETPTAFRCLRRRLIALALCLRVFGRHFCVREQRII